MSFDSGLITTGLKKAWGAFASNAVALILGVLIAVFGSLLIVTSAPLAYGFCYMCIKATRGEKVAITDVFYGFKSLSVFIRSWIYFIIVLIILFIVGIINSILSIIPYLGAIVAFILGIFVYMFMIFTLYVYVMRASENIVYALKESFNIIKSNILMTLVVAIIAYILILVGVLFIIVWLVTIPIAVVFGAYVLKEIAPSTKDES
ncbi:hypothetical protein MsAg5_00660 [Methanosarcinaceae archaeon Ag5]|uniref:DUF624 domain-containing protein n=2 Tax=Methanolapillus africanus TaxID=3028297 RepID=A0AAE4MJE4_9EURY|nr:hypothetical protein [Methanosarcinaceae archaeon Ag5]